MIISCKNLHWSNAPFLPSQKASKPGVLLYTPFDMDLTPYQIVVPVLALIAVLYAWSLMMRKKKTVWEVILWTLFWGTIAIIAIRPNMLSYLTLVTGIKNQENAVLFTSIGILFFIVFYLIIRIEELQQRCTRIVRSIALQEAGLITKEAKESKEPDDTEG